MGVDKATVRPPTTGRACVFRLATCFATAAFAIFGWKKFPAPPGTPSIAVGRGSPKSISRDMCRKKRIRGVAIPSLIPLMRNR